MKVKNKKKKHENVHKLEKIYHLQNKSNKRLSFNTIKRYPKTIKNI